jgi:hypothetical protein
MKPAKESAENTGTELPITARKDDQGIDFIKVTEIGVGVICIVLVIWIILHFVVKVI